MKTAFLLGVLAFVLAGCTSSDKDYIRNHVVLVKQPHLPPVTP